MDQKVLDKQPNVLIPYHKEILDYQICTALPSSEYERDTFEFWHLDILSEMLIQYSLTPHIYQNEYPYIENYLEEIQGLPKHALSSLRREY